MVNAAILIILNHLKWSHFENSNFLSLFIPIVITFIDFSLRLFFSLHYWLFTKYSSTVFLGWKWFRNHKTFKSILIHSFQRKEKYSFFSYRLFLNVTYCNNVVASNMEKRKLTRLMNQIIKSFIKANQLFNGSVAEGGECCRDVQCIHIRE